MKLKILSPTSAIFAMAAASFIIAAENRAAFSADGEYSVAYWGQTHRHFALQIYHSLTPKQIQKLCSNPATHALIKSSSLLKTWEKFHQKKRAAFCKSHPQKTWKLLGESPYFMLSPREGDHK